MKPTRFLYGLGVCAALAGQSAWATEPYPSYPVYPMAPLVSPYAPRGATGMQTTPYQVVPGSPVPTGPGQPPTGMGAAPVAPGQPLPPGAAPGPIPAQDPLTIGGGGPDGLAAATPGGFGEGVGSAAGAGSGMPGFIGQFIGPYAITQVPVVRMFPQRRQILTAPVGVTSNLEALVERTTAIEALPILTRGPYAIAENESPQPQDRIFATYNFYRIEGPFPNPSPSISSIDVHQATIGFEKTFFNGHASFGARVPMITTNFVGRTFVLQGRSENFAEAVGGVDFAGVRDTGPVYQFLDNDIIDLDDANLGDISLVFKFAFGQTRCGKVCSAGAVVTVPTGPNVASFDRFTGVDQDKHYGILQPFCGFVCDQGSWYIQGFSSVAFPLHTGDEPIIMFNSLGVGCWLYRTDMGCLDGCTAPNPPKLGCCSFIAPTIELHVNTPLSNGGTFEYVDTGDELVLFTDKNVLMENSVVLTGGIHFGFCGSSTLTIGCAVPLTVQSYDVEGITQLNIRF